MPMKSDGTYVPRHSFTEHAAKNINFSPQYWDEQFDDIAKAISTLSADRKHPHNALHVDQLREEARRQIHPIDLRLSILERAGAGGGGLTAADVARMIAQQIEPVVKHHIATAPTAMTADNPTRAEMHAAITDAVRTARSVPAVITQSAPSPGPSAPGLSIDDVTRIATRIANETVGQLFRLLAHAETATLASAALAAGGSSPALEQMMREAEASGVPVEVYIEHVRSNFEGMKAASLSGAN